METHAVTPWQTHRCFWLHVFREVQYEFQGMDLTGTESSSLQHVFDDVHEPVSMLRIPSFYNKNSNYASRPRVPVTVKPSQKGIEKSVLHLRSIAIAEFAETCEDSEAYVGNRIFKIPKHCLSK